MSQYLEPSDELLFNDLALEFFGEGRCSGSGRLGDIFADFMCRDGKQIRRQSIDSSVTYGSSIKSVPLSRGLDFDLNFRKFSKRL